MCLDSTFMNRTLQNFQNVCGGGVKAYRFLVNEY